MAKIDFDTCLGNNRDIYFMVSAGLIDDAQIVHKFGRNPSINETPETIWDESTLYPWSAFSTPSQLSIVSTSASDTSSGSGVFNAKHVAELYENSYVYAPKTHLKIPSKADIDVRAISAAVGTSISGTFNLIITKEG